MRKIQITCKRDLDQVLIGLRDYVKNKDSTRSFGDFYEKDTNYIQKRSGSGPHRAEGLREEQGQYQKVCRDCSIPSPVKRHTAGGLW